MSADGDEVRGDRPLPVRALADRQLALLSGDFATRGHIDDYLAAHRVDPTVAVEANSILALTEIVRRSHLLATVLPDAIADDHPHLRPVPLDPPLPTRTAVLLRRESAYESAAARAFARVARGWGGGTARRVLSRVPRAVPCGGTRNKSRGHINQARTSLT